jgi:hypothetical protein
LDEERHTSEAEVQESFGKSWTVPGEGFRNLVPAAHEVADLPSEVPFSIEVSPTSGGEAAPVVIPSAGGEGTPVAQGDGEEG